MLPRSLRPTFAGSICRWNPRAFHTMRMAPFTKSMDRSKRRAERLRVSPPSGKSILGATCPDLLPCTRGNRVAFELYSDVIVTRDVPEHELRAGDVGTSVERHVVPGVSEEGYSVEFFDMTGNTVAVVTVAASALRLPTPADRPAVRALRA